jgi:hypothetical protein
VRREIRHVELRKQFFGSARIVVGRSADQRESRQRDHGVDRSASVPHEIPLDGRPRVEARGEGRHDPQALLLERGDDAVVVPGIAGQQVGAQHQQPDRALFLRVARQTGQRFDALGHARVQARVIDADLGILHRGVGLARTAQRRTRTRRIAVHHEADHVLDVVVRAGEPVLQR